MNNSNLENEAKVWPKIYTSAAWSFVCILLSTFFLYIYPSYYTHSWVIWLVRLMRILFFLAIIYSFINILIISKNKMWSKISILAILSYNCGIAAVTTFYILMGAIRYMMFSYYLWFLFILLAIILGISSIVSISLKRGRLKGIEFTIMGIILGLASFFCGYPACFIW